MREIINAVFVRFGFGASAEIENCMFFENSQDGQQSYFLVHFLQIESLKGYFNSDSFEQILTLFEQQKALKSDIEKNTSLLIVAQTQNLEQDFSVHKNNLLEIEEDEFWFKKYVLVYSDASIKEFSRGEAAFDEFKACVLNNGRFTNFKANIFQDVEYFVSMQVFLKLPFLTVPIALHEQYLSIDSILQLNLSEKQLKYLDLLVGEMDGLDDDYWAQLKAAALAATEMEQLTTFLTKFQTDDQDT